MSVDFGNTRDKDNNRMNRDNRREATPLNLKQRKFSTVEIIRDKKQQADTTR